MPRGAEVSVQNTSWLPPLASCYSALRGFRHDNSESVMGTSMEWSSRCRAMLEARPQRYQHLRVRLPAFCLHRGLQCKWLDCGKPQDASLSTCPPHRLEQQLHPTGHGARGGYPVKSTRCCPYFEASGPRPGFWMNLARVVSDPEEIWGAVSNQLARTADNAEPISPSSRIVQSHPYHGACKRGSCDETIDSPALLQGSMQARCCVLRCELDRTARPRTG